MKKALFVASVYKFLKFEKNDMKILKDFGYEIYSATNMKNDEWLKDDGSLDDFIAHKHHIDFPRIPFSKDILISYKQVKHLVESEKFDIIHCHTPVAAAITRFAARKSRKKGTKVVYTCHGFHFHKKSGIKDWLIYYPIEFFMSFYSDMIITINHEDYDVIKKFPVREKRYIPGVGVDIEYISSFKYDKSSIRKKYDIPEEAFLLLSVGELSERKNHEVVIKAISKISDDNIYYIICGTGKLEGYLNILISELKLEKRVLLVGQRKYEEVIELQHAADVGVLPSLIEGLGLAGIETIASGKPIISSNVHGMVDYAINNVTGITCNPNDVKAFSNAIFNLKFDDGFYSECSKNASEVSKNFDIKKVKKMMIDNYNQLLKE